MWRLSLLLLFTNGGLAAANVHCDKHDFQRCYPSHLSGISFPENEEDLNELCPSLISYTNCLKSYAEECGIENSVVVVVVEERLEKFNQVILEACDQSSELHQDIAANVGCLKGVFENHWHTCSWMDAVMDNARRHLILDDEVLDEDRIVKREDDDIDIEKHSCLHRALDLACLASDASETCGPSAKELLLDIFKRLGHLEAPCTEENRETLTELLDLLEIERDSKLILRGIFADNYFA